MKLWDIREQEVHVMNVQNLMMNVRQDLLEKKIKILTVHAH